MKERVSANRRPSPPDDATARASLSMLAQALLFGLAYLVAAQIANWFSLGPSGIATFWPPAGLYLGVLLRASPRRWRTRLNSRKPASKIASRPPTSRLRSVAPA